MAIFESSSITILDICQKRNRSRFWTSWWLVSVNSSTMDTSIVISSRKTHLWRTMFSKSLISDSLAKRIFLDANSSRSALVLHCTWHLSCSRINRTHPSPISGVSVWCSSKCFSEKHLGLQEISTVSWETLKRFLCVSRTTSQSDKTRRISSFAVWLWMRRAESAGKKCSTTLFSSKLAEITKSQRSC